MLSLSLFPFFPCNKVFSLRLPLLTLQVARQTDSPLRHSASFASLEPGSSLRQISSMASERLDSSESHAHDHGRRDSTPYAARGGLAAGSGWFPLGYKEGFSQWVRACFFVMCL